MSAIDDLKHQTNADVLFHGITTGRVISTDDPQQMGRLRVFVPVMDDTPDEDVPWAFYGAPFAGVTEGLARGRSDDTSVGPVAYGMWAIPKVGSHVLVMCINGNPEQRVWVGCIPTNLMSHTMPHGRHLDEETSGPLTSNDSPLEPLHTAQQEAFFSDVASVDPLASEEYKTRGADRSTSLIDDERLPDQEYATRADDAGGYQENKLPGVEGSDPTTYSIVTPGFHSISMDDSPTSCRIRIRTTAGQQIIFDDSNERIYLSTAAGKTWLEFDEKGTIDMYAEHDVSIRSQSDVNIVSDQTVRIAGRNGVHISSEKEVRIHSGEDFNIKSDTNFRLLADENILIESTGETHHRAEATRMKAGTLFFEADDTVNITGGSSVEVGNALNVSGPVGIVGLLEVSGVIKSATDVTTTTHSLNLHTHTYILPKVPEIPPLQPGITLPQLLPTGSLAAPSAQPAPAEEEASEAVTAFFPSRAPQHEPWARTYLDIGLTDVDDGALLVFQGIVTDPDSVSEFGYDDSNVGKTSPARSKDFQRNDKWRR